ncbi:hypothetical protein KP509_33G019300 [Ceratopteris richardii]|nr:hypothetical protein KP509_33G019300 [Ceratopteris richardii]
MLSRLPSLACSFYSTFSSASGTSLSKSSQKCCVLRTAKDGGEEEMKCTSSPTAPLFDFSEYLLSGCEWEQAPPLPDFIGPLCIRNTHDIRGRGLFALEDVRAGSTLLVSNPFALTYNDSNSMRLYQEIISMIKQSRKALYQLASLAGYRDDLVVPPMDTFDPNVSVCDQMIQCIPELDQQRIVNVMNTNCFGGEVRLSDSQPAVQLNGLWLLPSFANHSCTPNANRLFVGKALLMIASRDISMNEEVTISYTNCLLPVRMREEQLDSLGCGFFCECQRCVEERSLEESLFDVTEPFESLHGEAVTELFSLVGKRINSSPTLPACIHLSKLFHALCKKLESLYTITSLQKKWTLASYSYAFLVKCFADYLSSGQKPSFCIHNRVLKLIEYMRCTMPGTMCTLSFIMMLVESAKQQRVDIKLTQTLHRVAMDECIRVYGNQKTDVLHRLMEEALHSIPYL